METSNQLLNLNSDPDVERISEIAEFYAECNVFLTGGTGFVGQLLIEKLLRSCPNIRKLYIILRAKKGKSSEERYKELFADCIYDRLKKEQPYFQSKIIMIEGEFNQSGLTISSGNRELIKDSHIVLHSAATVRFDDKLRFAVNINVRGTKEILLLCKQMPNLKAIVYIGTAFSHCVHKFIDEVLYEPPMDCDKILALLDILNDEQLESLTPILVGKYPNTYAFTKSTAENVVFKYGGDLPICIVRPSIMISTEKDPIPSWINNIYGPTGVVVGAGLGLLHSLHANPNNVADMIPADYVINNIIASAWDVGAMWRNKLTQEALSPFQDNKEEGIAEKLPIYNSVTSIQNPITWGEYMKYTETAGLNVITLSAMWYYFFTLNKHLWIHNIYVFAFHIVPAIILDTLARLTGREPMLMKTYKKIHKFTGVISYFCTQQWKFRNDNVLKLWDKMSLIDRKMFYFHVSEINWEEYLYYYMRGLRIYIVKDPMSTLDQAKRKYFKLRILHYTVMTFLSLLILWLVYVITSVLHASIAS